jgi:hypothetical protein
MMSMLIGILTVIALAGCEDKGPVQKAGERIDRAVDELKGKGPAEKAGERVDKAVDELTRKN